MRVPFALVFILLVMLAAACQAPEVCPKDSVTYVDGPAAIRTQVLPSSSASAVEPALVKIAGKQVRVNRVITGPLCDDVWSGTVYVGCNLQLVQWKDTGKPDFFKDCNLQIEPNTVVYVAAHKDEPYYNGCSCHTSK